MAKLSILTLRSKKTLLLSALSYWYRIYFQLIIPFLSADILNQELKFALAKPVSVYIEEQKTWWICSHLLFFYMIFDYPSKFSLNMSVQIKKFPEASYHKKSIFDELMALIKRNSRYLPLKLIYHKVKALLLIEDCQLWFNKRVFSVTKYCELINISASTFRRAS